MGGYADRDRERWVREDPARKRADRDDFARDRARLLHSAALRRLAAKTQVVRPDSDDFVRNRLTHSLEVAQIGREFGGTLGCNADVVDTACLAHDVGHPPFGHNGEATLAEIAAPIGGFEGNAQTLRVLTRLEAKRFHDDGRSAGLNLTRAGLDATMKYPWDLAARPPGTAKFGVYDDDAEVFAWVRQDSPAPGRRCAETQVMDWSDDVAYSVHDVEDAVASGLLDLRVLCSPGEARVVYAVARDWYDESLEDGELDAARERLLATGDVPASYDGSRRALAGLKDMTSRLIGRFVLAAESATRDRYGPGRLTRYAGDVVVPAAARAECVLLKALAAHYVMRSPARVALMETERQIVAGLLDAYLAAPEARVDAHLRGDLAAARGDAALLRVLVDQVASLTDVRARQLHARWCRPSTAGGAAAPATRRDGSGRP